MKPTYTIDTPDDIAGFLTVLYVVESPARSFAVCQCGTTKVEVVLGEPLCNGCDEPVADGPCSCEVPA